MRTLAIAAKWLFMLCLPFLLLTASLGWVANSLWLYPHSSEKYHVGEDLTEAGLKLSATELEEIYASLIDYFNSGEKSINLTVIQDGKTTPLFTPEEVIHFRDVKGLIQLDYGVLLGTLAYVLAYAGVCLLWKKRQYWRHLAWGLVGGGGITLLLILGLILLDTLLGFRQFFLQFHFIFFSNLSWSAEGYMHLLFPEDFFQDAALLCALITAGLAIILGGVGGGYLRFTKRASS